MQHLIELLTNPWVAIPLLLVFFGEFIPLSGALWRKIDEWLKSFGKWFLGSYEDKIYGTKEKLAKNTEVHLKLNNIFARILFFILSTIVIIFLEIFWELGFKGVTRRIQRSKIAKRSAIAIKKMPNWAVLMLFIAPFVFMEFIGIFALGAFVTGLFWLGVGLYIFKVLLFIPVHFVLQAGKRQLMSIDWFKRRYDMILSVIEWFKRSQTYIKSHNLYDKIRAHFVAIKNRFLATLNLLKKAFEHDDILSPECESVREEILANTDQNKKVELYEKFFNCVNSHLEAHKPKTHESQSDERRED